jgi:two-component system response regulator AtoC
MARVLLVDDEPGVLFTLREVFADRGHEPVTATSGAEALGRLDGVDAVVTDLAMPGMDGLALLLAIRERDPQLPVVLLTAHGSERVAVNAVKQGAYDYLKKPFDIDEITVVVERALEARHLRIENRHLAAEAALGRRIIGSSPAMQRLLDAVARVAGKPVTVLVRGETGTGKELVASLLHVQSGRARAPLVRFNCAAIPGELAEAELFGHAKGAFTGAVATRRGFFAEADGGTLVLDEIGELPLALQAKLLRVLQEGEIQPVGSGRIERVDVRVVACTNRDLAAEARAGRFREDLFYRLAVVDLVVPPLRERRADIPALCAEFARRFADKFALPELRLAGALVDRLAATDWPGNVRQLENAIARLAALSAGGEIGPEAFTPDTTPAGGAAPGTDELPLKDQLEFLEKSLIARAISASGGNQSEAARRLGMSRVTLIDRLKRYGL